MSKTFRLFVAASVFLLSGCDDNKTSDPVVHKSVSEVEVQSPGVTEPVDWNEIMEVLESDEMMNIASKLAGIDAGTLKEATDIEVDLKGRKVRFTVKSEDPGTAKHYAESLADAFALKERLAGKGNLPEEFAIPMVGDDPIDLAMDRDRMTYEKARKALEEDPLEEGEDLGEGVLFRKEPAE